MVSLLQTGPLVVVRFIARLEITELKKLIFIKIVLQKGETATMLVIFLQFPPSSN